MVQRAELRGFDVDRPPAVVMGDLTLIRPHGMAEIPVVAVAESPGAVELRSRHVAGSCIVPGYSREQRDVTAGVLTSLGAELHRRVGRKVPLVYGTDAQLSLVQRHRATLAEHYLFILNDDALVAALTDKERFDDLAVCARLRVPATWSPARDTAQELRRLREPLFVKPKQKAHWEHLRRDLFGGEGKGRVFTTRRELCNHLAFERHKADLIVQEHIEAAEGGLVSFHGFADERGRMLAWFCGRKLRTWPLLGGESAFIEVTSDPQAQRTGLQIAERLELKGHFKIDMIRDARRGELFLLEINARHTLWHHVGAQAGVNLSAVAYEHLVHDRRSAGAAMIEPGHRWVNVYRDYKAYRALSAQKALSLGGWLAALARPGNVYETFAWDDPAPFLYWAMTFRRRPGTAARERGAEPLMTRAANDTE